MKKILSCTAILFGTILSTITFATTLNMYEKPDASSKTVTTIESGKQLIPIFSTEKKDWIKVANPQNGEVGWIKASELKGPVIVTQVNGSKVEQIVVDKDSKETDPKVFSVIQYSSSNGLKPEDTKKAIEEMEKRNEKMRTSLLKMQDEMQKSMQEMFKGFDKVLQALPIIVIPEKQK